MTCLAGDDGRIESATRETGAFRLPTGAALYTALIAYSRKTGRSRSRSVEDCYGSEGRFITGVNLFGVNAEAIAQRLFAESTTALDVLTRHTLFGFYCQGQSEQVRKAFSSYLAMGDGASLLKYLNTGGMPFFAKGALRYCPDCAAEEWSTSGIAWWKTHHQLPFWAHCGDHGVELVASCQACGSIYDRGNDFRLPGERCRICNVEPKTRRIAKPLEGARALVRTSEAALRGDLAILQPATWVGLIDCVVRHFGGVEDAHRELAAILSDQWNGRKPSKIGDSLQGSLRPDFLSRELNLCANQGELAGRLITMNAILGSSIASGARVFEDFRPVVRKAAAAAEPQARLELAAIDAGIPVAAVRMIIAGAGNADVGEKIGISTPRLSSFLDSLPLENWAGVIPGRRLGGSSAVPLSRRHGDYLPESRKQDHYRTCLERAKRANPTLTRTQARQMHGSVMRWLTTNDFGWLSRLLPPQIGSGRPHPRFSSDSERLQAYRSRVLKFVEQHPASTRSEISKACPGSVAWLRKNDLHWFEVTMPGVRLAPGVHQRKYQDDTQRRQVYRKIIRDAIKLIPGATRSQLRRNCPKALSWIAREDAEWLDRIVPNRQGQRS